MINTRRDVQQTIDAISAALPAGWGVRLAPMSEESLEVFHGGEPGGGVFVLWCREVTVIQPSVLPSGERRGPVGDRVKVGDYRGAGRVARVAEGVLEGIRIFSERYAYALPTRKGEVKS